jgi:hypothetical protein
MQRDSISSGSDDHADQHLGCRSSSADQLGPIFESLPDIETLTEEVIYKPSAQRDTDDSSYVHQAITSKIRKASNVEQGTFTVVVRV